MRPSAPFQRDDLQDLEALLEKATAVVPMRDVFAGAVDNRVIGMRHDVDNHLEPAVDMAAWEAERGYRSTYFVLHSAPYWQEKQFLREGLEQISGHGHEIGIHNAALSECIRLRGEVDPVIMLDEAIEELRDYGYDISGTVAHGASECYDRDGKLQVVNDELFDECARPLMGSPTRVVAGVQILPVPLATFDLEYDANYLFRGQYISDSGGDWSRPFQEVKDGFPFDGQLHMLVHPDWWREAFLKVAA